VNKNLLHYLSFNTVNLLIGVAAIPVLTRLLGPTEYGHFVVASTIITMAHTVFTQWTQVAVSRFYKNNIGSHVLDLSHLWMPLGLSLVIGETLVFTADVLGFLRVPRALVVLTAVAIPINATFVLLMERLYITQAAHAYQIYGNAHTIGKYLIAIVLLLLVERSATWCLVGWIVAVLILVIAMLAKIPASELAVRVAPPQVMTTVAKYSWVASLANILGSVIAWVPLFVLNSVANPHAVALFNIVITIAGLMVFFLPNIILFESYPRLQLAFSLGDLKYVRSVLGKNLKILGMLGGSLGIGFIMLGEDLVLLVGGDDFAIEKLPLIAGAVAVFFQAVTRVLDPIYKLELKGNRMAVIHGMGAVACAIGCTILIPRHGITGAFFAMSSGYAVISALFVIDAWRFGYLKEKNQPQASLCSLRTGKSGENETL
jgi:O-antigen/teichoic acid export membrane protein